MPSREASARPALVVDDRQDRRFTAALARRFDVSVRRLKTGDLVFGCPLGTVGIEDKCIADLTASQANRRLDDELRRLVESFAVPVLFVRGFAGPLRDAASIANTLFGRQLHGVYTYQVDDDDEQAAEGVLRLYKYLQVLRPEGLSGVRRPAKLNFVGPLGPRAEIIYSILGLVAGVRNRRAIAVDIARLTPVSQFLRWSVSDFRAAGFTLRMARKLAEVIAALEQGPLEEPS